MAQPLSTGCPSPLALERVALGEKTASAVTQHVTGCPRCSARLRQMASEAARFSESTHSLAARARLERADRTWRKKAMLVALVPLAAAAAVAIPFAARAPQTAPPQAPQARHGLEVLEPKGSFAPPRLRTVSLRGQQVLFGQGSLEAAVKDGPPRPFTLRHTDVQAEVTGFASSVVVTQEFENPFRESVEAVYVFPLPDDAAVDEMSLTVGSRVIRATIQKRQEARRRYERAKQQGRHAALLDQERPNIFTQSVANLLPGEKVKVTLRYVAPLRYDDGVYTFNFPMVVGPRYVPGTPLQGEPQGTGTRPDTDQVPDASRISPPASRTGRDVSVSLRVNAGSPLEAISSVSHRLQLERTSSESAVVTLDRADHIPNRDLVVRWTVAGARKQVALLASGGPGGAFALMLTPEAREANAEILPKEMVFVIDTSCSMAGAPLEAAKRAMSSAIEQMNPDDTFMLIDFADRASSFSPRPLPYSPRNVAHALGYLSALPASGGTNQLEGIRLALGRPQEPGHLRTVLLLTDGFIGNEREIFAETERLLGDSRLFALGIGGSANHYLLSRLSQLGRGFYQYLRPDEDPQAAVERFVRRIQRPLLTDIEVDWGGLEVTDVLPSRIPDLFDAQPLLLLGRYRSPGAGTVTLRGRMGGRKVELRSQVSFPKEATQGDALKTMWARARIEELDLSRHEGNSDAPRQIEALGLEHHLVTEFTSLIAEEQERTSAPATRTVAEPTDEEEENAEGGEEAGYFLHHVRTEDAPEPKPGSRPVLYRRPPAKPSAPEVDIMNVDVGGGDGRRGAAGESGEADDEFDSMFGGGRASAVAGKKLKREVYVPPAPGESDDLPQSLGQADIMQVVIMHKPEILACVKEQNAKNPSLHGTLVLRWVIDKSGKVLSVTVMTEEFKQTPISSCLMAAVKRWTFLPHQQQGDPINFPFKF